MALVTIRPTSVISNGANFTPTGGADCAAVTNDNLDTSYFQKNSAVGTQSVCIGFGLTTLGGNEVVKRVRLRFRGSTPTSAGKMNFNVGTRVGSSNIYQNATPLRGLNVLATFIGAWFQAAPDGSAWDQARITNLRALVTDYMDTTDKGFVEELYIDVDKATQPTVSASAPTGTITSTATPDTIWAYVDPDTADPQAYVQVRVFTAAQYGIGGFDPALSPCTWDSGVVGSSDNVMTIGQALVSATYRAYVRVAKNIMTRLAHRACGWR